jgi:hypothetical protein
MLQLLLDYLTNTSTFHLMVHMIYIGMICMFLSLSYVAAFHWSSIVQLYEDANNHSQFSNNLKLSAASDTKITETIQKVMEDTGASRVYVYRYHNGLPAISGIPFFFQTNTHEVIAPGTSRLLSFEQRIPASIHVGMNNAFVANKCLLIPDTRHDQNSQDYYFFESRNAIAVERCPIYMENGDLFGFVGIDWNHTVTNDPKVTEELENAARDIGRTYASK